METFQSPAFLCVFKVLPHRQGGGKAIGMVCLQYLRCDQTTGRQMSRSDVFQWSRSLSAGFTSLPERTESTSHGDADKGGWSLLCSRCTLYFYMMPFTRGPGRTLQVFWALGKYNCTYSTGFKTLLGIKPLSEGDCPAVAWYQRKSCKNNLGLLILCLLS